MARPRKDQAIDIPARAVEASLALLKETSLADLTLGQVAAVVGCRPPALYRYFAGKADLMRAVHDAGFARLFREKLAVAARSEGDALARLRLGGIAYLAFAIENVELYSLMFAPPSDAGLSANPMRADVGRMSMDFLRESVRACQADGYFAGRDPALVAFVLWSAVHGVAVLIHRNRTPIDTASRPHDLAERAVDEIMALVVSGKSTRSGRRA